MATCVCRSPAGLGCHHGRALRPAATPVQISLSLRRGLGPGGPRAQGSLGSTIPAFREHSCASARLCPQPRALGWAHLVAPRVTGGPAPYSGDRAHKLCTRHLLLGPREPRVGSYKWMSGDFCCQVLKAKSECKWTHSVQSRVVKGQVHGPLQRWDLTLCPQCGSPLSDLLTGNRLGGGTGAGAWAWEGGLWWRNLADITLTRW